MSEEDAFNAEVHACMELILKMFTSYKIKRAVGFSAMLSIFSHELAGRDKEDMEQNLADFCTHIRKMHEVKDIEQQIDKLADKIDNFFDTGHKDE